jgi:hypothetical protein
MSDSNTLTLVGLTMMGGANLRVTGDRETGTVTSVEPVSTPPSTVGFSGDVEAPTMVPAMTAHDATEQHLLLNSKIAALDARLNAQTFDANTGQPTGFKAAEGSRERDILQTERQSLDNALQYLMHRALEQLPKRAERNGAADDALVAQAQREQNISALADTQDSNGKPIGRVRAAQLVDEATQRALADRLVRGK